MDQDFRKIWQEQEVEKMRVSMDELRERARRFQKKIRRRNTREQSAAALVVVVFLWLGMKNPDLVPRLACFLIAGAAVFTGLYIQARGSAQAAPSDLGATNYIEFHQRELARQRDLLMGIWRWYLGPFIPGFALFVVWTIWIDPPGKRWIPIAYAVVATLFFWMVGRKNLRAARRLDGEIQALDRELRGA
jgi:hypothetical protein